MHVVNYNLFVQVDNPQTGFYFCVPEASQNRLVNSTATLVLSQDVYFHNPPCVAEEFLSIPQLECAQTSTETDIVTPPGLSPDPQTTVGTDSTQMATTVAATEVLQQVILYVSIGAVIFSIVIICCGVIMAVHYCKKRRRNRFPKSKGQRSRVVTGLLLYCICFLHSIMFSAVCNYYLVQSYRYYSTKINSYLILANVLYTPSASLMLDKHTLISQTRQPEYQ